MRHLTAITILTTLVVNAGAAEAAQVRYSSGVRVSSTYTPGTFYRRGNFQAYVPPYRVINGRLHYTRGSFQGYIYRRR
jgi:hypothetical protein